MNDYCAVSIIVPVCNVQKFLRQCLDSLTDQTLQDIQIICIDDGSTDNSLEILQEYADRDPRVEVISKPNAGYGHTMNMGLKAARGEYVGIVESDDFAETDMFETLYDLALANTADVVKSNFYEYTTGTIPDNDPIVPNIDACPLDTVFSPVEDQNIFLTQPAIWSALYKRSFLEDNEIKFLETPGASFQDTSFNYKVFALAKRVIVTPDAFLHYRIDNTNSSVKSLKKVFCICDEYREMWEFTRGHEQLFDQLKYRLPQIQLGGYLWNLNRLTPAIQYQFYKVFVDQFVALNNEGLLKKDYFDDVAWTTLSSILKDPEGHFQATYGPIKVDNTFVLSFAGSAVSRAERPLRALLDVIGNNDEVYVMCSDERLFNKPIIQSLLQADARLHIMDGEVKPEVVHRLQPSAIQGNSVVIAEFGGSDWSSSKTPKFINDIKTVVGNGGTAINSAWVIGRWSKDSLEQWGTNVWIPLLFAGYYEHESDDLTKVPEWLAEGYGANPVSAKDYSPVVAEYQTHYAALLGEDTLSFPHSIALMRQLWSAIRATYDAMIFDERENFGSGPSVTELAPLCAYNLDAANAEGTKVSIIIPVYNSSKFIASCLESVLQQNLPSKEIICVDDGSTDDSLAILRSFAEKEPGIKVVSQFNGGAGSARNRGVSLASGEYFAFIDPDDTYPTEDTLSKLVNAAEQHNVKLSAGSFTMVYPDGSEKLYFGGEQHFYTIRKEGKSKVSSLETDYGWIRFLYHRTIFTEGNVHFPEYRWYEDPVFFVNVMQYCDEFYGITDAVYTYQADYKVPSWNVVKVRDLVKGIAHNLEFAHSHHLSTLYTVLIHRLNRDYYPAIMEYINDEEVFCTLAYIQGTIDPSMFYDAQVNEWCTYIIKPFFDVLHFRKNAVMRLAESFGQSGVYRKLQSIVER
ncbi:MAG: glycosyltransferase [Eggerthellaceae bacterium]